MSKSTFIIQSSINKSFGTAFVVDEDKRGAYLVTCTHVVEECKEDSLEIEEEKAKLLYKGSSDDIDLAVIYVEGLTNTKVLNLCNSEVNEGTLFEIDGFKPHKRESIKLEQLDGTIKKISEIYSNRENTRTYELSLENEDRIEKGYSGAAVVLSGTNNVIAVATDRNRNGKDAYAIPIAYLKNIWEEMPAFTNCSEQMNYKGSEKISFLKKMENQALNTIGGVIVMAVITGFIYDALKVKDTTEETVKIEAKKTNSNLEEIKALLKLQGGDETVFLEKYFGKDYQRVLENPQTYHNLKLKLLNNKKTTQELLEERDKLLKKITSKRLNSSVQKMINKAFRELRYDDVRDLLDSFIKSNQSIGDDLIKAHYQKALTYMEEEKFPKAKEEFEKYIPISVEDGEILNQYGIIYNILGEYTKAIEFYTKSLKINLLNLGENHIDTAGSYNNLGGVWHSKGEYDKALEFYRKSLNIYLDTLNMNHPSIATSYHNIGLIAYDKGEYNKAIEFYTKSLNIRLEKLDKNDPEIAINYNSIGEALRSKGEYDKAISFYRKSLKINLVTLGESHSSTGTIYNSMGGAWYRKGEYNKAIKFYNKSLKINIAILGEKHFLVAGNYNNIGLGWYAKGEYDKAIKFYDKALKIFLSTLGENHPSVATSYNNMGLALCSKEEYSKAIEFYIKSLNIGLIALGENHPDIAMSYINIGEVWRSLGKFDKAINFYNKSLKIAISTLGENHLLTAMNYNNIGLIWYGKEEYDKALEFYTKSLKINSSIVGENHPNTARSYYNIAMVYFQTKKYKDAYNFMDKAVKIRALKLPPNHPYLLQSKKDLETIKSKL